MYSITISKTALRALRKAPAAVGMRIREALDRLAENPDRLDLDVKRLQGRTGYRLRVGSYRVIYDREDRIRVLAVIDLGPRGDVYK